jgi:hypothetical protein
MRDSKKLILILHYMNQSDYEHLNNQIIDVKGMLATFIKKLRAKS